MNRFFKDKQGNSLFLTGLQAHNSSTGTFLLEESIQAIRLYGGNTLETPIYWNVIEPQKDQYDFSLICKTVDRAREAGLHLILLWFATSKNGHPNYCPDYIKLDPKTYRPARDYAGAPLMALSPHCEATLERDALAFEQVMGFLKEYDAEGVVVGVQIENEIGIGYSDRDYSALAQADYAKPVPECLQNVVLEDCGTITGENTWRGRFGRHAHEAFNAWYHARYIGRIAQRGRAIYDFPVLFTNVAIGETGYEEPGKCYNSGAAVGRVLDIWKKGAPDLDLLCPDIYLQAPSVYSRICRRYTRPDNALFIPESPCMGTPNSLNAIRAVTEYGAIGVCGFGAESTLDASGALLPEAVPMALTLRTLSNLAPLLLKYRGTGRIHGFVQEEFASNEYLKLEHYHVMANYFCGTSLRHMRSTRNMRDPAYSGVFSRRGRGILVQVAEDEFYLAGDGLALEFLHRPDPQALDPYRQLSTRSNDQLNFLSVEEGHFEGDQWVVDFVRNGDESNFECFAYEGQVVHIRLNPQRGFDEE